MEEAKEARDVVEPEEAGIGRGEKIGIIAVAVVAVLSLAFLAAVLTVTVRGDKPARQAKPGPYAHLDRTSTGDPSAKVQVLAILPLRTDCHSPSIAYLLAAAKEHPEQLRVRFIDRRLPHGEEELKRLGLHCASIVCNGRTTSTLPDGRKIRLEGGPDEQYGLEDLRIVLQGLMDQAYGEGVVVLPDVSVAQTRPSSPAGP